MSCVHKFFLSLQQAVHAMHAKHAKIARNKETPYYLTFSSFLVTLKVQPLGLLYMESLLVPWPCLYNTILTLSIYQNCVNSRNIHENRLK